MKRCPQCEFVYEDEQTLCDMDGSKLAFDLRPLPKLQALTESPTVSPSKSFWRGRLIPATAGLILATVLGLVYYVSTHRQPRMQAIPASQNRVTVIPVTPALLSAESPKTETAPNANSERDSAERATAKTRSDDAAATPSATPKRETTAASSTATKKKPATLNAAQPQPAKPVATEVKPKKQSKIGSLLKKTGQLLKKPFKF